MDRILFSTQLAIFIGLSGAFFAAGIIGVCRWLKWSPINITVNVNNPPGLTSTVAKPSAVTRP